MSQLRTWQRRHGAHLVAEVCPVPGMGTWEACARVVESGVERQVGLHFSLLTDAQEAADILARAMLPHECDAVCEQWAAIERRKTSR
jgi:hypothetical protein